MKFSVHVIVTIALYQGRFSPDHQKVGIMCQRTLHVSSWVGLRVLGRVRWAAS
jgi:hypothetical protein